MAVKSRRFWSMSGLLVALLATASRESAPAADAPRDVVRRMSDAVIAVLQEKNLSADAKRDKIRGIVEGYVDFPTMARLVLARNWSGLDDSEKEEFTEEFKQHLSVTYGKNVETYNNEKVQITGDRDEGRGDWTVQTKILRPQGGGGDILVDYRLRQLSGEWKVIDLDHRASEPGVELPLAVPGSDGERRHRPAAQVAAREERYRAAVEIVGPLRLPASSYRTESAKSLSIARSPTSFQRSTGRRPRTVRERCG